MAREDTIHWFGIWTEKIRRREEDADLEGEIKGVPHQRNKNKIAKKTSKAQHHSQWQRQKGRHEPLQAQKKHQIPRQMIVLKWLYEYTL